MGVIHASAVIRNPAEPERAWEGMFMVNTGATDTLVPRPYLEAIGLRPRGRRVYGLADGSEIELDITTAEVEVLGEIVGATVVYGEPGVEPLLGVTVLESAGLGVDPRNQSLTTQPLRL